MSQPTDRPTRSSGEFNLDDLIGGRYRVLSQLGRGGMGLVYKVEQVFIKKEFALKTIDKHFLSEAVILRFRQEAKAAFALQHPNIIAVNDFGVLEDQTPFLVMELVNGETLADRIKRQGAQPISEAVPMFIQVCQGLAYAHACRIVHRDIKPSNIMLPRGVPIGTESSIKLVDFGLAKFTHRGDSELQALTRTGEIFGSPAYMSPEQCSGGKIDHRSDIYSLGCVMFETLTGTPPFVGDNALNTLLQHQNAPPPTLKEGSLGGTYPHQLEAIVSRMLAKAPEKRYESLNTVAHELAMLQEASSQHSSLNSTVATTSKLEFAGAADSVQLSYRFLASLTLAVTIVFTSLGSLSTYYVLSAQLREQEEKRNANTQNPPGPPRILAKSLLPSEILDEKQEEVKGDALKRLLLKPTSDYCLKLGSRGRESQISDEDFRQIGNTQWIRILKIEHGSFDNQSLRHLTHSSNLAEIVFIGSSVDDTGVKLLEQCPRLVHLEVRSAKLTSGGAQSFARMKNLYWLSLDGTPITDAALENVMKNSRIASLSLNDCRRISDKGLQCMEGKSLVELSLNRTKITDAGLKSLAHVKTLQSLALESTLVTQPAIIELCQAVPALKQLSLKECPNIRQDFSELLKTRFNVGQKK
ncbi:MAG TPA: protein kinase [Oculatellaceae cyanobacterium]